MFLKFLLEFRFTHANGQNDSLCSLLLLNWNLWPYVRTLESPSRISHDFVSCADDGFLEQRTISNLHLSKTFLVKVLFFTELGKLLSVQL